MASPAERGHLLSPSFLANVMLMIQQARSKPRHSPSGSAEKLAWHKRFNPFLPQSRHGFRADANHSTVRPNRSVPARAGRIFPSRFYSFPRKGKYAVGAALLILLMGNIAPIGHVSAITHQGCAITGSDLSETCILRLNQTRIAVVRSVFTTTPYSSHSYASFYSFYNLANQSGVSSCTTANLNMLNTSVVDTWGRWGAGLQQFVNQSIAHGYFSNRTTHVLTDIQVDGGALFSSSGQRNFDVVIIGFSEYVTAREYSYYKHFVATGGKLIVLSASSFVAEVAYNPHTNTERLVRGHGWSFDGTTACRGTFYRWYSNNTNWIGGNQCCFYTSGYRIHGAIFNTSNPESRVMREAFGKTMFTTYVSHEDGSMTNSTGSSTIAYWNVTNPHTHDERTIRIFSHSYKHGTVLYTGIFGNDMIGSSGRLQFLVYSSILTNLYQPIKHIIVIVEENHTFDNYFGTYPGANGIAYARSQPVASNSTTLVRPFEINTTTVAHDLCHDWECAHKAYDNGKMDGFMVADRSNLTMGYFNPNLVPYYWDYASQYVLLDNFFTPVMTNSLANHLYLIAGQSGGLVGDSRFGAFNFTSSSVHNSTFYFKSIVDELDASHVSWKYYAGGYGYLNNWNPLPAFASFRGNLSRMSNLADPSQFLTDVKGNNLPSVAWVMPQTDESSEHAPYDISLGQSAVVSEINAVMSSSSWNSTAIFLTWDDSGGWYDHVSPPQLDRYGDGFRVPCLIISPYAKHGLVDHTQGDFTSLLKFTETDYSLPPLTSRDASANDLVEAFDFSQAPRAPLLLPGPFVPNHYPLTFLNGTLKDSTPVSQPASTTFTTTVSTTITTTATLTATPPASTVTTTLPRSTITSTFHQTNMITTVAEPDATFATLLVTVFVVGCLLVILATRRAHASKTLQE